MDLFKYINGKRYKFLEEHPNKTDAQKHKERIKSKYKSVRVIRRLADRRYLRYQIWVR